MTIASTNPATGETFKTFSADSESMIEEKLRKAATAARQWRKTSFTERSQRMSRVAALLEQRKDALGRLMTLEMGKLRKAAIAEVEKCANGCRYYAENAERHLAPEPVQTDARRSEKRFQPLGPVLAVMPWNFPFWQVFRFAAPALMAGNVGLLKHASNVPQCALAIEEIFRDAGYPEGCFQTLLVGSDKVKRIVEDPRVAAATLTGSDAAGRSLASIAGCLVKKTVLEDVEKQVRSAREQGAQLACGGHRLDRPGFFFEPTVLLNAKGTRVWEEEVFGPVAAVARARDLDEAIALANDTPFGLGSAAFTQDAKEIERLTEELDAGQVFINGMVKSDPRLPFGGVKASGYGRELSQDGIREFVNIKTVWIG